MVKIVVTRPEKEIGHACKLIEACLEKNNLSNNLTLHLDFDMKDAGVYYYWVGGDKRHNPAKLYINPIQCRDSHNKCASANGYVEDYSIHGVICHEFSHYIDNRLQLVEKFESNLIINPNCKADKKEHVAELLRFYLTSPYMLWLLSPNDFAFFKANVVNPTPCSKEHFISLYSNWSPKVKRECKKRFGIWVKGSEVFHDDI